MAVTVVVCMDVVLGVWLLSSLAAAGVTQYVSPFFYLCSFQHPDLDRSSNDVEQVALSVSIVGDPQFYVSGQLYDGRTLSLFVTVRQLPVTSKYVSK